MGKISQRYPDDPLAAQAQFFAGVCYLSLKDKQYDKARDAFEKVVAKYPKFDQLEQGVLQPRSGRLQPCPSRPRRELHRQGGRCVRSVDRQISEIRRKWPEALYYRGESLYAEGKKDDAHAGLEPFVNRISAEAPCGRRHSTIWDLTQPELGKSSRGRRRPSTRFSKTSRSMNWRRGLYAQGDTLLSREQICRRRADVCGDHASKKDFPLADYATLRARGGARGEKKLPKRRRPTRRCRPYFRNRNSSPRRPWRPATATIWPAIYAAAREWLGKVLAGGGADAADAAHWIARSWLKEKHPAEALAVVEKALPLADKSPRHVDLLMDQGRRALRSSRPSRRIGPLYARWPRRISGQPAIPRVRLYTSASAALAGGDYPAALAHA